jgi:hypothetical protein
MNVVQPDDYTLGRKVHYKTRKPGHVTILYPTLSFEGNLVYNFVSFTSVYYSYRLSKYLSFLSPRNNI